MVRRPVRINARRTLLAGFTTVRDVENEGSGYPTLTGGSAPI